LFMTTIHGEMVIFFAKELIAYHRTQFGLISECKCQVKFKNCVPYFTIKQNWKNRL